jgi:high-affinity iron transporter
VLLKGIFNFSPATTVLEAVVWVAYVVPVMFLFFRTVRRRPAPPAAASPAPVTSSTSGETA